MKTDMHRHGGGPVSLSDFAAAHQLSMDVRERSREYGTQSSRYYASFRGPGGALVEFAERGMLCYEFGNGETPELAISDYAQRILGKRLCVGGPGSNNRFDVPNEWSSVP